MWLAIIMLACTVPSIWGNMFIGGLIPMPLMKMGGGGRGTGADGGGEHPPRPPPPPTLSG